MRKSILLNLLVYSGATILLFQSCRDDGFLKNAAPVPDQSFVEEFDTATAALTRGWKFINVSDQKGGGIWQNGGDITPWFRAYSNKGSYAGFIGVDYTSTLAASATISNWAVSPPLTMQTGDKIIFYTRGLQYDNGAGDSTDYGNRLELNINITNDGTAVGQGTDRGDFTTNLLTINPFLFYTSKNSPVANAYPTRWTRFEATIPQINGPVRGRFAFRYYVTNAGSNGNASGVAIDSVGYKSVGY